MTDRAAAAALLTLAAAAVWTLAHPYFGVRHDGELYLAQALSRLRPDVFAGDLFFAYGSQDRFTLFSRLHALLIDTFGIGAATRLLLVTGQLAFAVCAALLVRRLVDRPLFWIALALVFSWRAFYGGWSVFSYAETFVTARTLAEPLCLAAMVLAFDGRMKASLGAIALASLLHPLIALMAGAFWWVFRSLESPRWWLLGPAAVLVVGVAAALDVPPFQALRLSYDDEWWRIVRARLPFVVLSAWHVADWLALGADAVVLAYGIVVAAGRRRRLLAAVAITGLLGLAATLLGADLLNNVLATGLQPWRSLWMLHLVAVAMLAPVAAHLWKAPFDGRAVAALVVTGYVATRFPGSAGALLLAVLLHLAALRGFRTSRSLLTAILVACALVCLVAVAHQIGMDLSGQAGSPAPAETWWDAAARGAAHPLVAVLLVAGLQRWLSRPAHPGPAAACVLALAVAAAAAWDRRTPWLEYVETRGAGAPPFTEAIGPGRQVLWYDHMLATWVLLSRPNWYSSSQGTGVLFNRGTALEYDRRKAIVDVIEGQQRTCQMLAAVMGPDDCAPDLQTLEETCRNAGDLDFVIMKADVDGKSTARWTRVDERGGAATFHLYDCRRLAGG